MRAALDHCCEQPPHEQWVPLFKIQVFFSCVSFSIIVPSLANYLRRMGADEWVLGVAVAVYSLGEMVGSAVFGKLMTKRLREAPATGPRRCLLETMVFGVVGSILYVVADNVGQSPNLRAWAPWVVVVGRFLGGIWTGGKMVVEQTYVGVAAREDRVTPLTSEIGVYAVLGFVAGPSVGALFAPLNLDYGRLRVDEFTAPGYFVGLLCVAMMVACYVTFNPSDGYAKPFQGHKLERRLSHSLASPSIGASPRTNVVRRTTQRRPDAVGLAVCLGAFFAHFYSFAIQETITTPFVTARYGWSQRRVDTLFAGVSVLSLATSVLVAELSNRWSDYDLLVLSLVLGFAGSLVLLDPPLWPAQLGEARFLAGFALITVAFPFGRNVALATFSKVLGPCDQGEWMGLMFVVGALPRCLGPSWSLYALQLACVLFPRPAPCPKGGRTCLEFGISALIFGATLATVGRTRRRLRPYDADDEGGERVGLV